jgi:hypothetical protein
MPRPRGNISAIILFAISLIAVLIIGQKVYLELENKWVLRKNEVFSFLRKEKQESEYERLVKKQRERRVVAQVSEDSVPQMRGHIEVNFVFVRPNNLAEKEITPLISQLVQSSDKIEEKCSTNGCRKSISLNYLPTFYEQEARQYNVSDVNIRIRTYGPYTLSELGKVGDIAYIWEKDPFGVTKLQDAFDEVLYKNNLLEIEGESVVFLYFDPSFENTDAGDRFYEHKKFRSFADVSEGKAYINIYKLEPDFASTVVEIAAHELLHLYGATDKYEESESVARICSERGRGEIAKGVPQDTADIMCMFVETSLDVFNRGQIVNGSIVVNEITAEEIGWKN